MSNKVSQFKIRKRRHRFYSESFKREAVTAYESSNKSKGEICRLLDIGCVSSLSNWCKLYGNGEKSSHKKPKRIVSLEQIKPSKQLNSTNEPETSSSDYQARIAGLENEVKRLRQALGNHAVKDYLAELREESWRELSDPCTLKEVERLVAKKL